MLKKGSLEAVETLLAEGEIYDMEYQSEVLAHGEGELTAPECEDAIGRQAAINAAIKESQVDGAYGYMDTKSNEDLRKKGKWIHGVERSREYIGEACININYKDWHCSECGYVIERLQPAWNFCPNCGADMRGEQDES